MRGQGWGIRMPAAGLLLALLWSGGAWSATAQEAEPAVTASIAARAWVGGGNGATLPSTQLRSALAHRGTVLWIEARNPGPAQASWLARELGLPAALATESVERRQRPVIHAYSGALFVALPVPRLHAGKIDAIPLNLILGRNVVVALHWDEVPALDEARSRFQGLPPAERRETCQLARAALTACLESWAAVMEQAGEQRDAIESGIHTGKRADAPRELMALRRTLLAMRRVLYPLSEEADDLHVTAAALYPSDGATCLLGFSEEAQRLRDELEMQTEAVGAAMDAHLAEASNQLNQTLNLLTVLGVCLALMGAVFGAWGMNFEVIPIAKHRWGFWLVFAFIAIFCAVLLIGTKVQGVW